MADCNYVVREFIGRGTSALGLQKIRNSIEKLSNTAKKNRQPLHFQLSNNFAAKTRITGVRTSFIVENDIEIKSDFNHFLLLMEKMCLNGKNVCHDRFKKKKMVRMEKKNRPKFNVSVIFAFAFVDHEITNGNGTQQMHIQH